MFDRFPRLLSRWLEYSKSQLVAPTCSWTDSGSSIAFPWSLWVNQQREVVAKRSESRLLSARALLAEVSLFYGQRIVGKRINPNISTASIPFSISDDQKSRITVIFYTVT